MHEGRPGVYGIKNTVVIRALPQKRRASSFVKREKPSKHSLPTAPAVLKSGMVSRLMESSTRALLSSVMPGVLKRSGLMTRAVSFPPNTMPVSSLSSRMAVFIRGAVRMSVPAPAAASEEPVVASEEPVVASEGTEAAVITGSKSSLSMRPAGGLTETVP